MVYCLEALLLFSAANRRDQVLSDVQARVSGKATWGLNEALAQTARDGNAAARLSFRFTSRLDQTDLKARIESFAIGTRLPLAGSWLTIHDCDHDEGANDCGATLVTRTW